MSDRYRLLEFHGTVAARHGAPVPDDARPEVWWNHIAGPALVLGSAQRDERIVDRAACAAGGVDVVRRRSGGGAVLLTPGDVEWIDVIVPAGGVGWNADVHRTMVWLGEHLATVVRDVLVEHAGPPAERVDDRVTVNRAGMLRTRWSTLVCFDGVGPGEVLLDGRKLIGISQRRTRSAARLQCTWYRTYDPARLAGLFAADVGVRADELAPVATIDGEASAAIPRRLVERLGALQDDRWDRPGGGDDRAGPPLDPPVERADGGN